MLCPACGFDNIAGDDSCSACGASLMFGTFGSDVEQGISGHPVNVLCPREPVVVQGTETVRAVVQRMMKDNIGCVLVQTGSDLVGIFTERDVLNKVSDDLMRLDRPVIDFMTPSPLTLTRQDSIGYALQGMDLGGYRHMPVVNADGAAVGMLSARDILRFVCVKYAQSRT